MTTTVYAYDRCSTCRKALAHLQRAGINPTVMAIRQQPPTTAQLKAALKQLPSPNKLFNTSGQDYRALGIKDQLPTMSPDAMAKLLASNGNLIKRPFVVHNDRIVVGYNEADWREIFGG